VIIIYLILAFNVLVIAWAIWKYFFNPNVESATGPECKLVLRTWVGEYDFIDMKCPPCHGSCNQGRTCPARV